MANNLPTEEGSIVYSETPESGNANIDALIFGFDQKWGGAVGTGVTITFSFPGNFAGNNSFWKNDYSVTDEPSNMSYLTNAQANAFRDALDAWSAVANINFTEITDDPVDGNPVGVIRVAFYNEMSGGTAGYAFLPSFFASSGDVWLNPDSPSGWGADSLAPGGDGFGTMLHELGHALGLSHPLDEPLDADFHTGETIMSYNSAPKSLFRDVIDNGGGSYTYEYHYIAPETPMPLDIQSIQYLYGKNMTHNTGNNTYSFSTTAPFIKTIWDAGGTDTISVSNFTRACVIDLTAGHYSSIRIPSDAVPDGFDPDTTPGIYDGTRNLAIAHAVTIENATGGAGNDTLLGNNAANVLRGNAGNDTLNGLGGVDTLIGGGGGDTYVINGTGEINKATGDPGSDLVQSSVTYVLGAQQERLSLLGTTAINGTGNDGANVVRGNSAANTLKGGAGNDTLFGGAGNDALFGGAGADSFQFGGAAPGGSNADRIADYNVADDTIYLADSKFTQLAASLGNDADGAPVRINATEFAANGTGQSGDGSDRIIYNTSTGGLFYDPDGTGGMAAVRIATLTGAPSITVNDLFVYDG